MNLSIKQVTDIEVWEFGHVAVGIFGQQKRDVRVLVHPQSKCSGSHCTIHNPSDHKMSDWPLNYRSDTGVMERMCMHGVGHPDPDDTAWHVTQGRDWTDSHGCDGCCR